MPKGFLTEAMIESVRVRLTAAGPEFEWDDPPAADTPIEVRAAGGTEA